MFSKNCYTTNSEVPTFSGTSTASTSEVRMVASSVSLMVGELNKVQMAFSVAMFIESSIKVRKSVHSFVRGLLKGHTDVMVSQGCLPLQNNEIGIKMDLGNERQRRCRKMDETESGHILCRTCLINLRVPSKAEYSLTAWTFYSVHSFL